MEVSVQSWGTPVIIQFIDGFSMKFLPPYDYGDPMRPQYPQPRPAPSPCPALTHELIRIASACFDPQSSPKISSFYSHGGTPK